VELSPEDRKLVTLARATRARTGARQGAAVRDQDGRTYAAATLDLPSLRVSALQGCVVMAAASGATGLEAAVLLGEDPTPGEGDREALRDLAGADVPLHRTDLRGAPVERGVEGE